MFFQEGQLLRWGGCLVQQRAQIPQTPGTIFDGPSAGRFQLRDRMFFRQGQQPVQDADGLGAAGFEHLPGPGAGVRANEPGAIQEPVGATLDQGALVGVDVRRVGGELAGLVTGMHGDLLPGWLKMRTNRLSQRAQT